MKNFKLLQYFNQILALCEQNLQLKQPQRCSQEKILQQPSTLRFFCSCRSNSFSLSFTQKQQNKNVRCLTKADKLRKVLSKFLSVKGSLRCLNLKLHCSKLLFCSYVNFDASQFPDILCILGPGQILMGHTAQQQERVLARYRP